MDGDVAIIVILSIFLVAILVVAYFIFGWLLTLFIAAVGLTFGIIGGAIGHKW